MNEIEKVINLVITLKLKPIFCSVCSFKYLENHEFRNKININVQYFFIFVSGNTKIVNNKEQNQS